jgi:hypothetical protein
MLKAAISLRHKRRDPNWSQVKLLMRNETSSFADSSPSPATITVGGTSLSTSIKKWGVGAASHGVSSTTSTFLTVTDDGRFALSTEAWTWEAWVYLPSPATSTRMLFQSSWLRVAGSASAGNLAVSVSANNFSSASSVGSGSLGVATWGHVAVSRSGANVRFFINGTQAASISNFTNHDATQRDLQIGGLSGGSNCLPCYVDELRITVGAARYTANFTAPVAPFPSFGA